MSHDVRLDLDHYHKYTQTWSEPPGSDVILILVSLSIVQSTVDTVVTFIDSTGSHLFLPAALAALRKAQS